MLIKSVIAVLVIGVVGYVAEVRGRSGLRWGAGASLSTAIATLFGELVFVKLAQSTAVFAEDHAVGVFAWALGPVLAVLAGAGWLGLLTRAPAHPGLDRLRKLTIWMTASDLEEGGSGTLELDGDAFRITLAEDGGDGSLAVYRGRASDLSHVNLDGERLNMTLATPAGPIELSIRAVGEGLEDRETRVRVLRTAQRRLTTSGAST